MFVIFLLISFVIIFLDLKFFIECIEIFFVSNKKLMKNSLILFGIKDIIWIMKLIIVLFKKFLYFILLGFFRKMVLYLYNLLIFYCYSL